MSRIRDHEVDAEFSALVESTEGLQPWRRVFHAGNGILIVLALQILSVERGLVLALLGSILSLLLLMDGVRLANPRLNRLFFQAFSSLASPREARGIASSTWYLLGVVLTLTLFAPPATWAGILVLALADPSAGFVGRKWGKNRLGAGTIRGSATFMVVACLALLPFAPWWAALPAAAVTTLVEAIPWPLDDNLTIPITAAGVLALLL